MKVGEIWRVKNSVLDIKVSDGAGWDGLVKIDSIVEDIVTYEVLCSEEYCNNICSVLRERFLECFTKEYV